LGLQRWRRKCTIFAMHRNSRRFALFAGFALASLLLAACAPTRGGHPLEGGWLADDGTVFVFRPDGTFHGYDFRKREIWGNWVTLSDARIGFQSLLHDSFYNPQYAIIDATNRDRMNYIVTGGNHFIDARRVDPGEAAAAVRLVVEPAVHRPGDD
jgi:hypothetical protein